MANVVECGHWSSNSGLSFSENKYSRLPMNFIDVLQKSKNL